MGSWERLRLHVGNEMTTKPVWKCWEPRKRRRRALREVLAPSLQRGRDAAWECMPVGVKLGAVAIQAAAAAWGHWRRDD